MSTLHMPACGSTARRSILRLTPLLCALTVAACSDAAGMPETLAPGTPIPVAVASIAADPSAYMSGVTVTVTGEGISTPLVFSLGTPNTAGAASTMAQIPAGPARIFTARAYTGAVLTHEGVDTVDVTAAGATINLQLRKLSGTGGITASVEDYNVVVDDSSGFRAAVTTASGTRGGLVSFTAKVTYAFSLLPLHLFGDPVVGATVTWASTNPGVASPVVGTCTTNASGVCTVTVPISLLAPLASSTSIVAVSGGVAHAVTLSVP